MQGHPEMSIMVAALTETGCLRTDRQGVTRSERVRFVGCADHLLIFPVNAQRRSNVAFFYQLEKGTLLQHLKWNIAAAPQQSTRNIHRHLSRLA